MQVSVVRPGDLGPVEVSAWRELQQGQVALSSPFLSPDFALAVGRARDDARVAVVEDAEGFAGFFAFQLGPGATGAPIGDGICDAQAFVCRAGLEWDPRWLVRSSGLVAWRFDHLRVEQSAFEPYHRALHSAPVMDLSDGLDAFRTAVSTVSKDVLAQTARRRRKLAREVGPVVTEWADPAAEPFDALVGWKSAQYAATGTWDRFEHRWIRTVLDELRAAHCSHCTGLLATTRAGGRLAAVHFGLAGLHGLSWWFPAYDPALGAYSPGLVLLLDLAECAAERRVATIDLGRGEHGYKRRVATGRYLLAEGEVTARRDPAPSGDER
ncbi:MAG TPA: GNAT family N-acetyltransferase [Acidimicrobiales bacterium]